MRKRAQQHAVYNAEDCCGPADGQSERKDHDGRGAGASAKHACAIANIRQKTLNGGPWPCRAAVFFDQSYIAKFTASGGGGFFSGHAAGDEFLDLFLKMLLNLFGEIVIEAATGQELL